MDEIVDLHPTAAAPIEAFGPAEWTRLRNAGSVRLWLDGDDVYAQTVDVREASVPDVAAIAPLSVRRICWGWTTEGMAPGKVRIAMAHRRRVVRLTALLKKQGVTKVTFLAAGVPVKLTSAPLPWATMAVVAAVLIVIAAAVPLVRPAPEPQATPTVAGATFPRSATGLLTDVGRALPLDARLRDVRRDVDGSTTMTVDAADPVLVRAALARDPALARLRSIAQQAIADRGVRVTLRMEGPPAPGRASIAPAQVAAALRTAAGDAVRLQALVALAGEPGVVDLSAVAPEAAMLRFLDTAERGAPALRFREWRLRPEPGSPTALRLEARAVPVAAGRVVPVAAGRTMPTTTGPMPGRRLFADGFDDPAVPEIVAGSDDAAMPSAPVLIGIAGRLPDHAVAIVRAAEGRGRMVALGAVTDGWRLEGLTADQAVFARGTARVRVRLAPVDEP